eukprot:gnl/TRDRNA2_/TRDRNA2_30247_c0_seq1.p1 gnl/TRDRNA2_/TRDRNA2_30247_c0~~gnl/TRDRNA2_/TRDRNA2_30247_c0_seq1.p1  ORF type:complete len:245 (-),score=76.06 gnl/TRDRNA2_/TRDRNA2_30247_c0_seq1:43-777(-)
MSNASRSLAETLLHEDPSGQALRRCSTKILVFVFPAITLGLTVFSFEGPRFAAQELLDAIVRQQIRPTMSAARQHLKQPAAASQLTQPLQTGQSLQPAARQVLMLAKPTEDELDQMTAKEAIDMGKDMLKNGEAEDALDVFVKALSLRGSGRSKGKEELSYDEKQAVFFNKASCYCQLAKDADADMRAKYNDEALSALHVCIHEAGFHDLTMLQYDATFKQLKADEPERYGKLVEYLLQKFCHY